jgi:omega-6 fatty acid desaturase (delta-12 desaturase)
MTTVPSPEAAASHRAEVAAWKAIVAEFQKPNARIASWQIVNSAGAYVALWVAMYFVARWSIWAALPLAVLAGGLLVRVFIIFHDCGHGSFFKSRRANDICGFICGWLSFTPYHHWRWEHSLHHATAGDLDRRGVGDVWTMTVEEYLAASPRKRFWYRVNRNPVVLFFIAPLLLFLVGMRVSAKGASRRDRMSVAWMNLAVAAQVAGMSALFGFGPYALLQLVVLSVAGSAGVWLFYVQHQFEDVYWERTGDWEYTAAALEGSSFYKLPKVLQWFSGNIGFHHIHHLSPRIPNYNLERCHNSHPLFQEVKPVTLRGSLKSLAFRLWDEPGRRLVGFDYVRGLSKAA